MIKKIVLIAAMGTMGLLWGSGDVTIQVINAVKEGSITHEFDKKLEKSGLAVHKVVEGGRYIVTLGTYKDEKSAQVALKKVRAVVCAGAFVRFVKRDQAAVASQGTDKSVNAKQAVIAVSDKSAKETKAVAVAASHEATNVVTQPAVKEVVAAVAPKSEHLVVVEVKPVVVEVKNTPAAPVAAVSSAVKKDVYRNEIAEAINYYKNSPYHRFEPVMLQH